MPVFVVLALSGAATVAVALLPGMNFASRLPLLRVALETAAPLIALVAAFPVFDRLLRRARLTELILACSISALALSELAFVTVPVLRQRSWPDLSVWASQAGSILGAALFALAAFVPRRRLRRLRLALGRRGGTDHRAATDRCPRGLVRGPLAEGIRRHDGQGSIAAGPDLNHDVFMAALEIMLAAIYGLAAAGFFRRSERSRDEFFGWLAVAAVLAAASHLNYFLYPSPVLPACLGRGCVPLVLLCGAARGIGSGDLVLLAGAVGGGSA